MRYINIRKLVHHAPRLTAWTTLALAFPIAADAGYSEVEVWTANEDGFSSHRIPGICVTSNGTVLVATEARDGDGDADPSDIVVKRSVNSGSSWSNDITIEASSGGAHWANPTFLVDGSLVYLFYAENEDNASSKVYYRTSSDHGLSWSGRTEITNIWNGNPYGWTLHLPGPGHGIKKIKNPDTGMLLLQVWHRKSISFPAAQRNYGVDVITKAGSIWTQQGVVSVSSSYGINESDLAERANGQIINIARRALGDTTKKTRSASVNSGTTWGSLATVSGVTGKAVDGGLVRYDDNDMILTYIENDTQRRDLRIMTSQDQGVNWSTNRQVYGGKAAYSDMAVDGTDIYMVYERGNSDSETEWKRIYVAKFDLAWAKSAAGASDQTIDCEDTTYSGTGASASVLNHAQYFDGQALLLNADGSGDRLTMSFTLNSPGTYKIRAYVRTYFSRGRYKLTANGVVKDLYSSSGAFKVPMDFGNVTWSNAGTATLHFECDGKNSSSSGFTGIFDRIVLEAQ